MIGIEHIEHLAQSSFDNLSKSFSEPLHAGCIKIVCGDGRLGYAPEAPYDAIHVGAGTQNIPEDLLKQLKIGGKLVIPVGHPDDQYINIITRQVAPFTADPYQCNSTKRHLPYSLGLAAA